ncbi:MAG: hypothetical protein R2826_03000 [Thermoleophilia bacterium]
MSNLVLLIIGLVCAALVLAMLAYVAHRAWRVYKRGMRVSRNVAPLLAQVDAWSIIVEAQAQRLGDNAAAISENVARIQASVQRLTILAQALREGSAPYRRLRNYLGL